MWGQGQPVIPAPQSGRPILRVGASEVLAGSWDTSGTHRATSSAALRLPSTAPSPNRIGRRLRIRFSGPDRCGEALEPLRFLT